MSGRHHKYCDWHMDQYFFECTCGAERPKAVWFDAYVRECDRALAEAQSEAANEAVSKKQQEQRT